jgi:hypothetical protein
MFTTQEEMYQNLRNDLLLSMANIRKDVHLATNVVPKAGTRVTGNMTLVLRQPVLDGNEEVVDDTFQYVSYTIDGSLWNASSGDLAGGILREVWDDINATAPTEQELLNDSVIALGFLYGGQSSNGITNFNDVRDIEIIMISGRETGLSIPTGEVVTEEDYYDLAVLEQFLEYGLEFPYVRVYLDYINSQRVNVAVASSMGSATFRNQRVLGLTGEAAPL